MPITSLPYLPLFSEILVTKSYFLQFSSKMPKQIFEVPVNRHQNPQKNVKLASLSGGRWVLRQSQKRQFRHFTSF